MKRLLSALALIAALSLAPQAEAQTTHSTRIVQKFEQQSIDLLGHSSDRDVDQTPKVDQTLKNVVFFSTFYRDKMKRLGQIAEAVIARHQRSTSNTEKDLALAALQAIGRPRAVRYVSRHASPDEKRRLRRLVAAVLGEESGGAVG